jgi:hypothetical protein
MIEQISLPSCGIHKLRNSSHDLFSLDISILQEKISEAAQDQLVSMVEHEA